MLQEASAPGSMGLGVTETNMAKRISNANYEGMSPAKWPDIPPEDQARYDAMCAHLRDGAFSGRERADAQRWLHYLFDTTKGLT